MTNVRWGIIGTGDVMEVKSGPGLYKLPDSEVIGVYNRTFSKGQDYAKRHHIDKVYASPEDLIHDKQIDMIYIATPPVDHKAYALEVLGAGKIPYIEKPVAMTYEESLEFQYFARLIVDRGQSPNLD